jgi:dihydrofolate reductase
MSELRVHSFSVSIDGYGAGPDQARDKPLGVDGTRLHEWIFKTRYGRQMIGQGGGELDLDHAFLLRGDDNIGATIMGRNMFGPIRDAWEDDSWTGWWGDVPPYHHDVFVLTHHAREPVAMQGGTVFHFVTDGIESALEQATAAAHGADIRLGGGVGTIQQYLRAGLVDELHLALVPVLLGRGERLFANLDDLGGGPGGLECVELVASSRVAHVVFRKP